MADKVAAAAGTISLGGLRVRRMGFGAMRITGEGIWGSPPDRGEAKRLLRLMVERGVTLIDTADSYGPDVSEELIAEALYPYPDDLVIATKGGSLRPGPAQWVRDGRPEHLREACEGSLRRLRLEQLPLYQLHAPDPNVPLEESIGALVDLQMRGKIRYIGVSNVDESQLALCRQLADVVAVQNRYNLLDRRFDGIVDICERDGLVFLPWAPLERGEADTPELRRVASRRHATPQQIMLAWLLARSPAIVPIPGSGNVAHAELNAAAAAIDLSPDEMADLERGDAQAA